jgi:hypothetical protein
VSSGTRNQNSELVIQNSGTEKIKSRNGDKRRFGGKRLEGFKVRLKDDCDDKRSGRE